MLKNSTKRYKILKSNWSYLLFNPLAIHIFSAFTIFWHSIQNLIVIKILHHLKNRKFLTNQYSHLIHLSTLGSPELHFGVRDNTQNEWIFSIMFYETRYYRPEVWPIILNTLLKWNYKIYFILFKCILGATEMFA